MKLNFKKISTIVASALMASMTVGLAAAAAYPAPFISGGTANVAIVYGTGSNGMVPSTLDLVEAAHIQSNLQSKMGTSVGTSDSISGEAKSLTSGTDLLYLNDDLAENVGVITKDDLPTVLADGTFTDDTGSTFDFEQTIETGTSGINAFTFGNSGNDFDDPALMLNLSTSTTTYPYRWVLSFDQATNLTSSDSEGQEISIFGKTYTIGTATDTDTLVLLGGSSAQKIYVDETATMEVNGVSYDVSLDGLSSDATTVASITINGETKTFTQGQTKTYVINGENLEVYVKTVFRTGDDGSGHIEIELGANKLTFETANSVKYGSDNTEIEGTLVTITPTPAGSSAALPGLGNVTKITIAVSASDNEEDHIIVGESFTDPVFGTLKLEFNSVANGPVFSEEEDIGRTALKLVSGGNRELRVEMTDSAGVTKTIPFTYNNIMQNDANNIFHTIEGDNMTDEDYFILNSGDYEHLMRVKHLNFDDITGKVQIQDIFTGTTYTLGGDTGIDFTGDVDAKTGGQNYTINSQTYTFTNTTKGQSTAAGVKITRAGASASTTTSVFPYIELIAGEDFPRVAFINQTNRINETTGDNISMGATGITTSGKTYELPTGTVQFRITNGTPSGSAAVKSWVEYGVTPTGGGTTWTNLSGGNTSTTIAVNFTSIGVGEAYYLFATTTAPITPKAQFVAINNVTLNTWINATTGGVGGYGDGVLDSPAIMLVEPKDKSDGEARNIILINTTDDGTYSEMNGDILFSGTSQQISETWDDTKLKGYLTNYGTYALRDQTDTNIHLARLSYGTAQMYANVYLAEAETSITAGSTGGVSQLGEVLVKDSEVSSVSTKNLIVVGGSCINSAAAKLIGSAACGASFTTATGVGSGQFIIKGYDSSSLTNKLALLVAGYDAADTVNAATYLRNKAIDTSKEYLGTSATSATLVTSSA